VSGRINRIQKFLERIFMIRVCTDSYVSALVKNKTSSNRQQF
jgi:hypothetical protein